MPNFSYDSHVARNMGYIAPSTQENMRFTPLLIAGCGIGSGLAVLAARMGFTQFILVDGDTLSAHNLNRQFYSFSDVGRFKVDALKDHILAINPEANVAAHPVYLTLENTAEFVSQAGLVFDTVDFLDLGAILTLHRAAHELRKPIITALSVGFGALTWVFQPSDGYTLVDALTPQLDSHGAEATYADVFADFMSGLAPYLDAEVVSEVQRVLALMREGAPCPASQVAVGSFAIAAMAGSLLDDIMAGRPIMSGPQLHIHSFKKQQTTRVSLKA